jgi:hypothetical protein
MRTVVDVRFDPEAFVWVVTPRDRSGLVTEADSLDVLAAKVRAMADALGLGSVEMVITV